MLTARKNLWGNRWTLRWEGPTPATMLVREELGSAPAKSFTVGLSLGKPVTYEVFGGGPLGLRHHPVRLHLRVLSPQGEVLERRQLENSPRFL